MRNFLGGILICPQCRDEFKTIVFSREGEEIIEGLLYCTSCGRAYPIINAIPRILEDALQRNTDFSMRFSKELQSLQIKMPITRISSQSRIDELTQRSFSFQWSSFSEMSCDFKENFLNYIYPKKPAFFKGKIGLDAGCGFGRHIYNAAQFGSEMVGMDFSSAIDSAYQNTKHLKRVHLVQADIYKIPFRKNTFDFVYSIGVLHHLSQPEAGFRSLIPLIKPKGAVFVWVYSNKRKFTIALLEAIRGVTTRIPHHILKNICFAIAGFEWIFFLLPFKKLNRAHVFDKFLSKLEFSRFRVYEKYPFQVSYADWFDRLSAPVRFYYSYQDIGNWFYKAKLKNVRVSATGLYGWRGYGEKTITTILDSRAKDANYILNFYKTSDQYLKHLNAYRIKSHYQVYFEYVKRYLEPNSRFLDLGCGTGYSSYLFSKEGFYTVGFDISFKFISTSSQLRNNRLRFVVGDGSKLPFKNSSFDAIGMYDVLEHMPDIKKLLEEIRRILKVNGKLVIITPNILSPFTSIKALFVSRGRHGIYSSRKEAFLAIFKNILLIVKKMMFKKVDFTYRNPNIYHRWSKSEDAACYYANPAELKSYLLTHGFKMDRYQKDGPNFLHKLAGILLPNLASTIYIVAQKRKT